MSMTEKKILFDRLPWEEPLPGMRFKSTVRDGKRLRLVELTPEFREPEGCLRGHIGYVLEGKMEIDFPDGTESYSPGDGIFILGGEGERHQARIPGKGARLLLVDEVEE